MSSIQAPKNTGWFKLNDTWIRLCEVQAWKWFEESSWMLIYLKERKPYLEVACDRVQAMAFEAAIQEL